VYTSKEEERFRSPSESLQGKQLARQDRFPFLTISGPPHTEKARRAPVVNPRPIPAVGQIPCLQGSSPGPCRTGETTCHCHLGAMCPSQLLSTDEPAPRVKAKVEGWVATQELGCIRSSRVKGLGVNQTWPS